MKRIQRVAPKSLMKVLGFLYGLFGLIGGLIFLLISLVSVISGNSAGWFGLVAVIFLPVVYGLLGAAAGYVFALLYNFTAKKVGGIEFEVE